MVKLILRPIILLLGLCIASIASAQEVGPDEQRYVVDIELQSPQEFGQLLERAEQLLLAGVDVPAGEPRVTFVLHGPVLNNLLRQNYLDNKRLVDLAASLSAMDVIEVKACRTWMKSHSVNPAQLQPFVEAVNYGPAVVDRLLKEENHVSF